MKYFSYIDQLHLSVEDLVNFSPYILKQVKEDLKDYDNVHKISIVAGLEDNVSRSYHITIEKNEWLKALLFKNFSKLKKQNIELNLEHVDYIFGFKRFIELYLRPVLTDLLDYCFNENELRLFYNILNKPELFSDACNKHIKQLLSERVNNATDYLNEVHIENLDNTIRYIKDYHFYEILNLYMPYFNLDILRLYDCITAVKSQFKEDSDHHILRFVLQTQVAFEKSKVDDVASKLLIDDNAENAKEKAYKESSVIIEKSSKIETTKPYIRPIIIAVLLCFFMIFGIAIVLLQNTFHKEENIKTSTTKNKKKKAYDNRIQFYYSLKLIAKKKAVVDDTKSNTLDILPFSNPYPKTFMHLMNDSIASEETNMLIDNRTDSDLIIFKMVKGKDKSIYIPKNKHRYVALNTSDSLLFVSGKNFVRSKFSHFTKNMAISEIYKFIKTEGSNPSKIIVKSSRFSSDIKYRIITKKDIEVTEGIELYKIKIDNLYRDYYYKKH